ncbi:tripartite tricarboxylate transporter permease [Candidatus Nanohalobium constans]|uniref:Putative membrane protein, tripartite tricarboxylate transporter TctA family n=1 Tax=Candidatus Nanohalobium constans TaxID=2565781 RepID=A0A5Q0UHB6_9ARCH|nr:tripartite tricarboxylate transporter permease [Candidatus Nanohalobium constans]QGA81038.1 putative membrane protein, tripartite tricarboxylate transporter TctA family [Candidatus Nanohalobium constans]
MLEILAYSLTGVLLGVFTGLIPGIHPNTVIFSSIPFYLTSEIEFILYAALISGLSISHTFHDFIPAFYLQAPEGGTALSMSVGSEMASNGRGFEAFNSTLIGGITSLFVFILMLPVLYFFLKNVYAAVEPFMAPFLAFFLFFLIFRSGRKEAFIVAGLAGTLGLLTLNSSIAGSFILMPIFSGLFAVPAVLSSIGSGAEIPGQEESFEFEGVRGGAVGFLAGTMAGVFPGLGAAGSTSFLMPLLEDKKDFLAGMGGVNTSDIAMSLVSLLVIGKARSGSSVALSSLTQTVEWEIFLLIGVSIFCAGISALTALRSHNLFLQVFELVSFRFVGFLVLAVLLGVSFVFSGVFGVLVLLVASLVGGYSFLVDCRSVCMAVLLVPAIFFFL